MKNERRWDSCQAQVAPRTTSWMMIQRTTRAFVDSDWSLNSASRSYTNNNNNRRLALPGQPREKKRRLKKKRSKKKKKEMTDPLENLLPADIVQPGVEVADARGDVLQLVLVVALDLVGLANDHVEAQADAAVVVGGGEPAGAAAAGRGREADLVVARVGGGEGEAAGGGASLGDDAVVVVKDFLPE